MIFLSVDQYDATEMEERPKSSHVSRKDWKILAAFLLVAVPIGWFFYVRQLGVAQSAICDQNLAQIQKAMGVYMETNNGRFPPAFVEEPNHEPMVIPAGNKSAPFTWISLIQPGFETRASFVCPSAGKDEVALNLHPERSDQVIESTYGMYMPRSGWPEMLIQNPESAILISETSNRGANSSFDPKPFSNAPDGCVIGWDNSNTELDKSSSYVTRLAFSETSNGKFLEMGPARHETTLHVLFVSGRRGKINSGAAKIDRLGTQATGYWADR